MRRVKSLKAGSELISETDVKNTTEVNDSRITRSRTIETAVIVKPEVNRYVKTTDNKKIQLDEIKNDISDTSELPLKVGKNLRKTKARVERVQSDLVKKEVPTTFQENVENEGQSKLKRGKYARKKSIAKVEPVSNDKSDIVADSSVNQAGVVKTKLSTIHESPINDKHVKEENDKENQKLQTRKRKLKKKLETVEETVKKIKIDEKNVLVPVDSECKTKTDKAEVYVEGDDIYDVMLNQTNLQFNNNKFYLIQLLKDKHCEKYSVWMRWARVGKIGQTKLSEFGSNIDAAKKCFCQKFSDKTRNDWSNRSNFVKVHGKYDLVLIDYEKKDIEPIKQNESNIKLETMTCTLDNKIQDLLRTIFDINEMDSVVNEMKYDSNKLPLGRLTEAQIRAGYTALKEIESLLVAGKNNTQSLVQACNDYYTRIPHDFGMKVPTVIRSLNCIKQELELLETLSDIKIALNLINDMGDVSVHPLDRHYQLLKCDIKPVSSDSDVYQLLNKYLILSHGSTHTQYSLIMRELYELRKDSEWTNFTDYGNKMLLWHGSRTTNYGGILSQGLRIAPPEAPITGHMFDKGVYFADMSSKAANYVFPTRSKNTGFLLLCEVSLGMMNELVKSNSNASKLPTGCQSVKGLGIMATESSSWEELNGATVPIGRPFDTGLAQQNKGYVLNYNEYIVYNTNQIKLRYLVKVEFKFK